MAGISISSKEFYRYLLELRAIAGGDVTINCAGGQTTRAHHVVLAVYWPTFRQRVTAAMAAGEAPPVTADALDIAVADMNDILEVLYAQRLNGMAAERVEELAREAKKIDITLRRHGVHPLPPALPMPHNADQQEVPLPAAAEGGDNNGHNAGH